MAPSKNKPPNDDRSESSSIKDRSTAGTSSTNGKPTRRQANAGAASSLRDTHTATGAVAASSQAASAEATTGIQWSTFPNEVLEAYRYAYRLNHPPAFRNSYNQAVLSQPGIGSMSPTMARNRDRRKRSKEQLANALRKHFNSMGIVENDVVVDFLYKIRWQDKAFRMHLTPSQTPPK